MIITKAQSAMEYLMTYGWAILIIAVVLAALFQLGVFSGGNFSPKAQAGSCQVQKTAAGISLEGQCNGMLPQFVASFSGTGGSDYFSANSVTSYVTLPNTVFPLGAISAFTFTAWIKTSSTVGAGIIGIGRAGLQDGYCGTLCLHQCDSGDTGAGGFTQNIYDNSWHFVAASFNYNNGANTLDFYVGQQLVSTSAGEEPVNTATPFAGSGPLSAIGVIGCYGYDFNGEMSNVQVYNTTLSPAEVNAIYLEGIGGAPIRPQNLVGWWPLNGDVNDYSGNNNDGSITNVIFSSTWENSYTAP